MTAAVLTKVLRGRPGTAALVKRAREEALLAFGRGHARALPRHDGAPVARAAVKGRAFLVVVRCLMDAGYVLLIITTIG